VVYCGQLPSSLSVSPTLFFVLVVLIGMHGDRHRHSLLLTVCGVLQAVPPELYW
jgi:hypothetical protein